MSDRRQPQNHKPDPVSFEDDSFLEDLLAATCRDIDGPPGEALVSRAHRWTRALKMMTDLRPTDRQQWLLAADVARLHFAALHSLALYKRAGAGSHEKKRHGLEVIGRTKALREGMLLFARAHDGGAG